MSPIFQAIIMVVMFVLGCIAMRRWMLNQRPAAMPHEGMHPTDKELLSWFEEGTGLFADARDKGFGWAWEDSEEYIRICYFYKVFDDRPVVYGTWDYINGMKAVEKVKYTNAKPHPNQIRAYNQPQYPPEFGYDNHPNW